MKVLVELDFMIHDCRIFAEIQIPDKGMMASEIEYKKSIIESVVVGGRIPEKSLCGECGKEIAPGYRVCGTCSNS